MLAHLLSCSWFLSIHTRRPQCKFRSGSHIDLRPDSGSPGNNTDSISQPRKLLEQWRK